MKRLLIGMLLVAAAARAQAPETLTVMDYECKAGRLASITFLVAPVKEARVVELAISTTVCGRES